MEYKMVLLKLQTVYYKLAAYRSTRSTPGFIFPVCRGNSDQDVRGYYSSITKQLLVSASKAAHLYIQRNFSIPDKFEQRKVVYVCENRICGKIGAMETLLKCTLWGIVMIALFVTILPTNGQGLSFLGSKLPGFFVQQQAGSQVDAQAQAVHKNFLTKFSSRGSTASRAASGRVVPFAAPGAVPFAVPNPKPVDMVFPIDCSGSVKKDQFDIGIQALVDIMDFLDQENGVTKDGIRVAVVSFGAVNQIVTEFDYILEANSNKNTLNGVKAALKSINYCNGPATATKPALDRTNSIFGHGRANAEKAVFIMTDGESNAGGDPCATAASIKSKNIEIFVMGVGNVKDAELNCMATSASHIFKVNSFSGVQALVNKLKQLFYS